jgi:calcineurin-like phosphoesterase family protein
MTIDETKNLWFISDTHFNHAKLVKSCPERFDQHRIYETTEEMNADIIEKWNKFIGKDDTVIFVGDYGLNIPASQIVEHFTNTMNQLNGNKIFICGNHDKLLRKKTEGIIQWHNQIRFTYKGKNYCVQHYDYAEKPTEVDDVDVLVHGHTHSSNTISRVDTGHGSKIQNCVCWEAWYRPVNYIELQNKEN